MPARTAILYADTGGTKSTQLALMALRFYKQTGKRSLLVTCTGGGSSQFEDMGLISSDIVKHYDLAGSRFPIAYLDRLSKGFWPNGDIDDDGYLVINNTEPYKINFERENIGLYLFDSLSEISSGLMEHASNPDTNIKFKLGTVNDEDGFQFGTVDKGHYLVIQKRIRNAFSSSFKTLPINYFLATALIDKGEDMQKVTGYYPASAGKSLNRHIPAWFMDCFHLSSELVKGSEILRQNLPTMKEGINPENYYDCKVAWIQDHADKQTEIEYKAKYRIAPQGIDKVHAIYPEGYVILDTTHGIYRFYGTLSKIRKEIASQVESDLKIK